MQTSVPNPLIPGTHTLEGKRRHDFPGTDTVSGG